ncbi:MAG TPA: hypothetical protein VMT73_08805 [Anaerolineales bacterium]|nr:hypothetical protein [Anaerolineales bacterium]
MTTFFSQRYSKQGLWSLFLICAFPLHLWTLLLAFRDLSWLTDRTNAWDAIGVASYGMVFAFIESLIIFLFFALLGFLIAKQWEQNQRISLLSALVLILSLWAIIGQLYFLLGISFPDSWVALFAQSSHPLRVLYIVAALIVALTLLIPAWFILRSDKALHFMQGLSERLSLLTMVYLFFDVVGLVIVIIRNIA